jgi:hypothetical protein
MGEKRSLIAKLISEETGETFAGLLAQLDQSLVVAKLKDV